MHAFGLYDNHESKLWHKKLWSKNTPAKHKHVRLQEWLEIVYWRQKGFLFYTETNPQKRKTKQVAHILPRDMLLRQIYFGFLIHVTQPLALVHNTYPKHTKKQIKKKHLKIKRLVTTPKGDACAPLQSVTQCFQHSHLDQKGARVPSHTETSSLRTTTPVTKTKEGAASECMLEGERGGEGAGLK